MREKRLGDTKSKRDEKKIRKKRIETNEIRDNNK